MIPLRMGTDAEFGALRSFLAATGYTEPAICRRLGIQNISQFEFVIQRRKPRPPAADPDALDLLISLFLENDPLARDTVRALPLDVFSALGLITAHTADQDLLAVDGKDAPLVLV